MKNRIVVLQDGRDLKVEKSLLKRGFFDFSMLFFSDVHEFEDAVLDAKLNADNVIVLCKNDLVDGLVDNIKDDGDEFSLVFEQAIKVENKEKKFLFVPTELDLDKFLDNFLPEKPQYSCLIFGKSEREVARKFGEFSTSYRIITKSPLLHIVHYSKQIEEALLKATFGESFCALNDEDLSHACAKFLGERTLSVAEQISGGFVSAKLASESVALKKCEIVSENTNLVSHDFLEEHGVASKETAYELAKMLLKDCDIALSVVGFDVDGGRCFVAVGNKQEIHVFSSTFYGSKKEIMENVSDFALFRLLKFLQEKSL